MSHDLTDEEIDDIKATRDLFAEKVKDLEFYQRLADTTGEEYAFKICWHWGLMQDMLLRRVERAGLMPRPDTEDRTAFIVNNIKNCVIMNQMAAITNGLGGDLA